MGAATEFYEVKCKESELDKQAKKLRKDACYDHGHSGYTGTIAEDSGNLTIVQDVMSYNEAEEYIYEIAEKWENSIAVPLNKDKTEWLIGGCYSC